LAYRRCDISETGTVEQVLLDRVATRAIAHLASPVTGRTVLDLSCRDGSISRWLAHHGANVTGIDPVPDCIEMARSEDTKDSRGISFVLGDPADLYMVEDSAFDDVFCNLSLSRIERLSSVVAEVARIIRLGGRFVFTVAHPCFDPSRTTRADGCPVTRDYYMEGEREGINGPIYHRTLASYINAVAARGFTVRRMLEPSVEDGDIEQVPELSSWRHAPVVLAVEAVFPRI
jgi:ubiquinone/menaquinone biosynthesis C-methylase UbiE